MTGIISSVKSFYMFIEIPSACCHNRTSYNVKEAIASSCAVSVNYCRSFGYLDFLLSFIIRFIGKERSDERDCCASFLGPSVGFESTEDKI